LIEREKQVAQQEEIVGVEFVSTRVAIVALRGEHDISTRTLIVPALAAAAQCPHVVIDLTECTFADSSVISTMLDAAVRKASAGGALELIVPCGTAGVWRTLELMGVVGLLRVHETREAAIASIELPSGLRLRAVAEPAPVEPQLRRNA
jgi:anti-anti-sigma factor